MLGLQRIHSWDRAASLCCNRMNHHFVGEAFAFISRMGDGWVWFALMAMLPMWYGNKAWSVTLVMLATGAVATLIYKFIKNATHRLRPCEKTEGLLLTVAPLDRFSFPSGHTLHAVCFTVIACSVYSDLIWFLMPFTLLVAISRLVLGLHYLSDVLVGAMIGGSLGSVAVLILGNEGGSVWN
jgi:undecaprenyl-diphosphatase